MQRLDAGFCSSFPSIRAMERDDRWRDDMSLDAAFDWIDGSEALPTTARNSARLSSTMNKRF
jgi:hypothetical protein